MTVRGPRAVYSLRARRSAISAAAADRVPASAARPCQSQQRRVDASAAFYQKALGFRLTDRSKAMAFVRSTATTMPS